MNEKVHCETSLNAKDIEPTCLLIAHFLNWAQQVGFYHSLIPLIAYRGHANKEWKLLPSLFRRLHKYTSLNASDLTELFKQKETEVILAFRERFDLKSWSEIEILAHARHCGAPTRLLDWSRNPLVGLWFAVAEKEQDTFDGVVYQLCLPGENEDAQTFICSPVGDLTLEHADNKIGTCKNPIHMFSSPNKVERTQRQQSVFTIVSLTSNLIFQPLEGMDFPLGGHELRHFVIPAKFKKNLRRLLSNLGLDAYSIYGDADSFGKSLAAHFEV